MPKPGFTKRVAQVGCLAVLALAVLGIYLLMRRPPAPAPGPAPAQGGAEAPRR